MYDPNLGQRKIWPAATAATAHLNVAIETAPADSARRNCRFDGNPQWDILCRWMTASGPGSDPRSEREGVPTMPTAQDILAKKRRNVAIIGGEATVMEAAKIMSDQHIGSLVVGRDKSVVGIFTERDVLNRVVAKHLDPMKTIVKDVMTTPVACCQPTTKLAECRSVMTEKRIRHLPVVMDNKLVGMISSGDILALEYGEQQRTIEYMYEYLYEGTR